jgi:hypothetical protein
MRSFVIGCCLSLLVSGVVAASDVRACGPAVAANCVTSAVITPSTALFVPTIVSPFAATTFVVPQAVVVQQAAVLQQAAVPHVVTQQVVTQSLLGSMLLQQQVVRQRTRTVVGPRTTVRSLLGR